MAGAGRRRYTCDEIGELRMTFASLSSRSLALFALLAAGVGLGFSCDKSVNDGSVSVLVTVRSSLGAANQQSGGDAVSLDSRVVSISADGRYIAFATKAPNLVSNDNNGAVD